MKKFFYNLMIMAALIMTSAAMVSCDEDDDNNGGSTPGKEDYLAFVYWMSNDLAEIVDVTTPGISNFTCNKATTVEFFNDKLNGVATDIIEFTGDKAKNPEFAVNLKLKSNWKDLINSKTSLLIYSSEAVGHAKGSAIALSGNCKGSKFTVSDIFASAEAESIFIQAVENKGYVYKK